MVYAIEKFRHMVAPHAGAWIETHVVLFETEVGLSRPTRARGLKLGLGSGVVDIYQVAPHAGAWIETDIRWQARCRISMSRPTRARGLKLFLSI